MKCNRYMSDMMMAAALLTAVSCTDFDDYNDEPTVSSAKPTAEQTVWQIISQREDLSDFVSLVKRVGYDETLNELNAYTVWVPKNGTFDAGKYAQISDSLLREQFVKNHIAKFNYSVMGEVDERVCMLNGKYYQLKGNGEYTYGDMPITESNVPCSNGTLHLLTGNVPFYPNLYEYIMAAEGIGQLRDYFKKYHKVELNLKESEKGPMVNGMQTYVDSVLTTSNELLTKNRLNAALTNEDSSYTVLMPTDEAYTKMYNNVRNCYKYLTNTTVQDVEKLEQPHAASKQGDTERNVYKKVSDEINPVYLADSLARLSILRNLAYSNRDTMNVDVIAKGPQAGDSLKSTRGDRFSNPEELLNKYLVGERVKMSNGWAHVVDSLAFKSWEFYNPELEYEIKDNVVKHFLTTPLEVTVPDSTAKKLFDSQKEEFKFNLYYPTDEFCVPNLFVKLPKVRAAAYNFYCVVLPASQGRETTNKPTPLNFDLSYCGSGGLTNYHFSSKVAATEDSTTYHFTEEMVTNSPINLTIETAFISTETEKADTIYLGQFAFPFCYEGLESGFYPSLNITCPLSYSDSLFEPLYDQYSTEMRIYSIILRPVEKSQYEANKQ